MSPVRNSWLAHQVWHMGSEGKTGFLSLCENTDICPPVSPYCNCTMTMVWHGVVPPGCYKCTSTTAFHTRQTQTINFSGFIVDVREDQKQWSSPKQLCNMERRPKPFYNQKLEGKSSWRKKLLEMSSIAPQTKQNKTKKTFACHYSDWFAYSVHL